jgi:hypothetical protein
VSRLKILGLVLAAVLAGCASTPTGPLRIDGSGSQCQASWNVVSCPDEQHRKVLRN